MKPAIAYYRVSTDKQGKSGLGLDAQKNSVDIFCKSREYNVTTHYEEIESGKKNDRPMLVAALKQCKKEKATLIIAKLDRLSRNVSFISNLMESGVKFVAADYPEADDLMLHMVSAFSQHERKAIGIRTKEALQAAKRRGVRLGSYGTDVLSKVNKEEAIIFANIMKPVINCLKVEGFTTIRAITQELNKRSIPTYRNNGTEWHIPTVFRLSKSIMAISQKLV